MNGLVLRAYWFLTLFVVPFALSYEELAFGDIGRSISARSYYIASYALCGFSNLGSIGIQLGGLTPRKLLDCTMLLCLYP